jgi:hypothetical protein
MTYEFTAGSKAFWAKHDGSCSERGESFSRGEQIIKTTAPPGDEDRKYEFTHLRCVFGDDDPARQFKQMFG